jgi:intraflagellar transport protein 140
MVAQYLQRLEWRSPPEILKYIVQMYHKAKNTDRLIEFYEGCAQVYLCIYVCAVDIICLWIFVFPFFLPFLPHDTQVEIDEYLEYEKALMALREALRYQRLSKTPPQDRGENVRILEHRIRLMESFIRAKEIEVYIYVYVCVCLLKFSFGKNALSEKFIYLLV